MPYAVQLAPKAIRDLRRFGPGPHQRQLADAISALAAGAPNLDIKPLQGRAPWLRLRSGDYRLLYRPLSVDELGRHLDHLTSGYLVERVVHRRDLDAAVATLP